MLGDFNLFFITSPSMRKKLRPDVASDTSRRNNNCVTTQHQIRRDENEGTNSHHNNIWQFPALFRELPYILLRCVSTICIYNMAIWQLKQRIQTFLFFLHQSNDIPRPKAPYGKYSHHEDKYICSNTTYEDSTAMSLQSHIP